MGNLSVPDERTAVFDHEDLELLNNIFEFACELEGIPASAEQQRAELAKLVFASYAEQRAIAESAGEKTSTVPDL